ncbi:hypothetical protein EAI_04533 [Harpegnathos saltator]|uniref:Uncharacterized protein n=1 Tax=Harpegnathos saltator TaxID=610380 RepID=E2B498_HARSA|nr:hypothetical protein EAI_04533 [Harpegnathos saltator]
MKVEAVKEEAVQARHEAEGRGWKQCRRQRRRCYRRLGSEDADSSSEEENQGRAVMGLLSVLPPWRQVHDCGTTLRGRP